MFVFPPAYFTFLVESKIKPFLILLFLKKLKHIFYSLHVAN